MKREVKIGMFLTIVMFILILFILIVGNLSVLLKKSGYSLFVNFDSAAGLEKGTLVRLAGVKAGFVKDIRLKESHAEVELAVQSEVKIRKDSKATLAALGLLGEKYIEILPGGGMDLCQPGDTLEGVAPVSFDQMGLMLLSIGNEVKDMGKTLKEVIGEEESKVHIKKTLENLSLFTTDLKDFFAANKQDFSQGLERSSHAIERLDQRFADVAQSMDELVKSLKEFVDENRVDVRTNLKNMRELIAKTEQSLGLLNNSLEKINKGEGTLGKLVQNPDLYDKVAETVDNLDKMIRPLSTLRTSIGLRTDYYSQSNFVKSYLTFSLWQASSRFLLGQIIRDPWLKKFTYSVQGGVRIGPFSPRAGVMESKIGAGLDYYALEDRLKIGLEGFDFNREPRPRFRFWSSYSFSKYFSLLLGIDDFTLAPRREVFFGLGVGL